MPIPQSAMVQQPADQPLLLHLTANELEMLNWIAGRANCSAATLVEAFIADLCGSWRSGGSDERESAFSWFVRRGFVGEYLYQPEAVRWRGDEEAADVRGKEEKEG